jgi:phosphate uptake regulator
MTVPTEITDGSDAPRSPPDLRDLVLRGFRATHSSADTLAIAIASGSWGVTDTIRRYEEDLDTLDRQVNEGVTGAIVLASETRARELLAYLKLIIDLERISDLLLNVANRLETVGSKLAAEDLKDLGTMACVYKNAGACDRGLPAT